MASTTPVNSLGLLCGRRALACPTGKRSLFRQAAPRGETRGSSFLGRPEDSETDGLFQENLSFSRERARPCPAPLSSGDDREAHGWPAFSAPGALRSCLPDGRARPLSAGRARRRGKGNGFLRRPKDSETDGLFQESLLISRESPPCPAPPSAAFTMKHRASEGKGAPAFVICFGFPAGGRPGIM